MKLIEQFLKRNFRYFCLDTLTSKIMALLWKAEPGSYINIEMENKNNLI